MVITVCWYTTDKDGLQAFNLLLHLTTRIAMHNLCLKMTKLRLMNKNREGIEAIFSITVFGISSHMERDWAEQGYVIALS